MTMIFSAATREIIVMTVDSAVTNEFNNGREYDTGKKYYVYDGVGCVTTWCDRVGNNIGNFLSSQQLSSDKHSVSELRDLVFKYLKEEYKARETDSDDIGYHVAGFDRDGNSNLYHIFWGTPRPNPNQETQDYYLNNHSPNSAKPIILLYNGRNDIANTVVNLLISEIEAGKDVRFDLGSFVGLASFGDFVARFAAELTPEVGPPFFTILISPENRIEVIKNDEFRPVGREKISEQLTSLGFNPSNLGANSAQKADQQKISHVMTNPFIAPSGINMPRSSYRDNSSTATTELGPHHSQAGTVSNWILEE